MKARLRFPKSARRFTAAAMVARSGGCALPTTFARVVGVAERLHEGSRGIYPTVWARTKGVRREATPECGQGFQASLRDADTADVPNRGLKATATIIQSLRDLDGQSNVVGNAQLRGRET